MTDSKKVSMQLPRIFYWAFGGISVTLLFIAAILFYYRQMAAHQYSKVEGIVIRNQYNDGMARPVIRYQWQGQEMIYADNTYSNPPAYERNEKVELFVNPNDPNDVWINSFMGRYFVMTLLGGIGLVFLGFLVLFHVVFTKQ
jgi:hypothetical protein